MTSERKQKQREYYQKNKERIYQQQQVYMKKNRKKINKLVNMRRKEVAIELKNKGQMYCYLPKTERQNKMVEYLCKKSNMSKEESRAMLEIYNWNIKQIINEMILEKYKEVK